MESRDVFENDDGPEPRFTLFERRKRDVQDIGPRDEPLSDPLRGVSEASAFCCGTGGGDFDRGFLDLKKLLRFGLLVGLLTGVETGSSDSFAGVG